MAYFVNVYRVTREYGGREEGGWWYNEEHPHAHVRCSNRRIAHKWAKRARKDFAHLAEGNIYSVLGGQEYTVRIEKRSAYYKPRPRYE